MMDALRSRLGDLKGLVYVADSSLVTGPNIKKMDEEGIRFISRLPALYSIEAELKERAHDEGKWREVGALSGQKDAATYRVSSYEGSIDGTRCRFVVVHSSKLDKRKEKAFEREGYGLTAPLAQSTVYGYRYQFPPVNDAPHELPVLFTEICAAGGAGRLQIGGFFPVSF